MYFELGNLKEAEVLYWELLNRNPENSGYYKSLEKAVQPGIQQDLTIM